MNIREMELSRLLAKIFRILPTDFSHAMIAEYFDKIDIMSAKDQSISNYFGIQTEMYLQSEASNRYDIFYPLSYPDYTCILYEIKIGKPDPDQLNRYAKVRKDALIVSLAKEAVLNQNNISNNIICITWEDFCLALLTILPADASAHLYPKQLDLRLKFSPNFPKRNPGGLVLEYLEDFLREVRAMGLVKFSSGKRIMVTTGSHATETCKNCNIQQYGVSWDNDFDYVCVVFQKKIQYFGKVVANYRGVVLANGVIDNKENFPCMTPSHQQMIENLHGQEIDNYAILQPEQRPDIIIGAEYQGRGAFTQSHRYFDTVENFISAFINPG